MSAITPPPELVQQWEQQGMCLWQKDHHSSSGSPGYLVSTHVATQAARWGADQELEACCEWCADESVVWAQELRAARRPKPSLRDRALHILGSHGNLSPKEHDTIRKALEQLND